MTLEKKIVKVKIGVDFLTNQTKYTEYFISKVYDKIGVYYDTNRPKYLNKESYIK